MTLEKKYTCGAENSSHSGQCDNPVPHPDARCQRHPKTVLEEPMDESAVQVENEELRNQVRAILDS